MNRSLTQLADDLFRSESNPAHEGYNGNKICGGANDRVTVLHEAGHGLGLDHTTTQNSIMYHAYVPYPVPTDIDIKNCTIKYNRPPGNTSPDTDPMPTDAFGVEFSTYDEAIGNDGLGRNLYIFDPTGMIDTLNHAKYDMRVNRIKEEDEARSRAYEQERTSPAVKKH